MNKGAPHNPFALEHHRCGTLPYLFSESQTVSALFEASQSGARQGQILGSGGTGKTTLLHAIAECARETGLTVAEIRAAADGKIQPFAAEAAVVCVDEADRISWWRRAWLVRFCRRHGQVLIVAAGRDVGLPTLWKCEVDDTMMVRVAEMVLARSPDAKLLVTAAEAPAALGESQGSARDALLRMYDWYEERWVRNLADPVPGAENP